MHHGNLRNSGRRQPRLVGKAAPALDEHFRLIKEIGAAGFDQAYRRQLVLQRDLLDTQVLLHSHRGRSATFDRAVVGRDDAADAGHIADAGNAAATLNAFRAIVVVHAKAGKRREFEPRRAGINN